ncbi:MAG: helix-turn-helix domain-containing protein [Pseudonocardiaceae bacterium]
MIGVTQPALHRYERGLREPEPDILIRLAHALGVTEEFLRDAGKIRGAMAVDAHMRRRATEKATTWRRLEARLNEYRIHATQVLRAGVAARRSGLSNIRPGRNRPTRRSAPASHAVAYADWSGT